MPGDYLQRLYAGNGLSVMPLVGAACTKTKRHSLGKVSECQFSVGGRDETSCHIRPASRVRGLRPTAAAARGHRAATAGRRGAATPAGSPAAPDAAYILRRALGGHDGPAAIWRGNAGPHRWEL